MPQLEQISTYASQIFWLAVVFAVLLGVMIRVALPRVQGILEERQKRIDDDFARAAALRDEAGDALRAYEQAQADARTEARRLLREQQEAAAAEAAARHAALGERLAGDTAAAEARIAEARRAALAGIEAAAGEVAQAMTARLIGVEVDAAEAAAAAAGTGQAGA